MDHCDTTVLILMESVRPMCAENICCPRVNAMRGSLRWRHTSARSR